MSREISVRIIVVSVMCCFHGFGSRSVLVAFAQEPDRTDRIDWPKGWEQLPWSEQAKKSVENAIAGASDDTVSAYLQLAHLLNEQDTAAKIEDAQQRAWLNAALRVLRPKVQLRINTDYRTALEAQDLRAALIAVELASKIKQEPAPAVLTQMSRQFSALSRLMATCLDERAGAPPIWDISDVAMERRSSFSESYGLSRLELTPDDGHELIHVTATAKHISPQSDPPYVGWVLPNHLKAAFDMDSDERLKLAPPTRLASGRFLFLRTANGTFPCRFVGNDARTLIGGGGFRATLTLLRITNTKVTEYPGSLVEKEQPFPIDAVFSVPKGSQELQLIFLGSPPISLGE